MIIWLTGLLGAGKSTLAEGVAARMREGGRFTESSSGFILGK